MTATEPTTTLTATSLYATSGLMRAAIAKWVADKRCPLELGDFLEEHGLVSQADCARWCATMRDRPNYYVGDEYTGPFPHKWSYWAWTGECENKLQFAHRVPIENTGPCDPEFKSPREAILWLLDNWVLSK